MGMCVYIYVYVHDYECVYLIYNNSELAPLTPAPPAVSPRRWWEQDWQPRKRTLP